MLISSSDLIRRGLLLGLDLDATGLDDDDIDGFIGLEFTAHGEPILLSEQGYTTVSEEEDGDSTDEENGSIGEDGDGTQMWLSE